MCHDALGAVEHPAARGRFRRRQNIAQVVARLALAMSESQGHAAFGDLRQDRRLLRLAAGKAQCSTTEHNRRQIGLERQCPAERLHYQHDLDRPSAKPTVLLGKGQAQQALLGVARPQRPAPSLRLGEIAAALRKAVMVSKESVDTLAQQALLVGQLEIHVIRPSLEGPLTPALSPQVGKGRNPPRAVMYSGRLY